jgi:hypothetical protein
MSHKELAWYTCCYCCCRATYRFYRALDAGRTTAVLAERTIEEQQWLQNSRSQSGLL